MVFYQLCKWSWPHHVAINGGYEEVFSTREAAEGALRAFRDRGDKDRFVAELHVSDSDLSKEFIEAQAEKVMA